MRRHWWVGLAAIPLVAVVLASPASAGHRRSPGITVHNLRAVSFAGQVTQTGPTGPASVPECAEVNCDHIVMNVDLPDPTWFLAGGVQVTITWDQLFNDVAGLAVYQDGVRVALSNPVVTSFQSVRLNTAANPDSTPNGTYDIYVAYNSYPVINEVTGELIQDPSPTLNYTGWAQVQYKNPDFPSGRDLLPNLEPLVPTVATFNTPAPIFGDAPSTEHPSCFLSEVQEQGSTLCLRIEQRMWNVNGYSAGPVEIRFNKPAGSFPDVLPAVQRIYRSDGTFYDRSAGTVDFHPVHGHYHYSQYSQTSLYAIGSDGQPSGPALRQGIKNGFCLADTDVIARQNESFVAPMVYTAPDCLFPRAINPDGTELFVEGEGPGNGDTYDWDLPDQYVPVAGLADGVYIAQTVIDPEQKLLETDNTDNCISVRIQLTGLSSDTPTATILGPGPACTS